MLTGWLIVNHFLHTAKFSELYNWFESAAQKEQLSLTILSNADFLIDVSSQQILLHGKPFQQPDFVLFWDKDIRLARALEQQNIRLYNCADAIEACDDKSLCAIQLAGIVKMPHTITAPMTFSNIGYTDFTFLDAVEQQLYYPFIIKECFGSFGMQVYLVNNHKEAIDILSAHAGTPLLFQEYIRSSTGRDIRMQIVGNQPVTAMLRYNDNDFRANITNGGLMKPWKPTPAQIDLSIKVCQALNLDFAGVDILFGEQEEPILCEVNSNAHFKNIFQCTNINVADAIMAYIKKESMS